MHEASLVSALLKQLDDLVVQHGGGQVTELNVQVGLLSGVEPTLFDEAYRRLCLGTSAEHARLIIDAIGLECRCRACHRTFTSDALRFDCPDCGARHVDVVAGDAVVLQSFTLTAPAEVATLP